MARIRTIKPSFFRHEGLFEAERETELPLRVAFAGLWTAADKEGRFRWAPRTLKLDCLPHDDVDFSRVLDALATRGFIVMYRVDGKDYGYLPTWKAHQVINNRESPSELPEPNETNTLTRAPRVDDACPTRLVHAQGEGKGREGEGKEIDADASRAEAQPRLAVVTSSPEKLYFDQTVQLLGKQGRSLGAALLKAKEGNVLAAHSALLTAAQKSDPREYIGAIINKRDSIEDLRARGDAW